MNTRSIQELPPKVVAQFAERARNGEGVPIGDVAVEFPQNGNVICIMYPNDERAMGHMMKNPKRAEELRRILAERSK